MIITLNIEKVEALYYEIAHDQYLYSDSEQTYYNFDKYYEALRSVLITKAYISNRMSMERICYLTIIVFFFDRLKYKESYRKAFESVLGEIMEV